MTPSVDEKPFLCHVPSTKTPVSVTSLVPLNLEAASNILFSAACLEAILIEFDRPSYAFFDIGGGMFK